ncbi:MAG: PQQ-binding-like beta-propeller repeat protein [Planctomycetes bacterium]|nr:PQQ-binding-like beta-propeller repeat protein [Planctomycetota bacterium]
MEDSHTLTSIILLFCCIFMHIPDGMTEEVAGTADVILSNQHVGAGENGQLAPVLDIAEDAPSEELPNSTYRANTHRTGEYKVTGLADLKGVKWKFKADDWIVCNPVESEGTVYFGSLDKRFYAVDSNTGKQKWVYGTNGEIWSSPTLYKGIIYFGSLDGSLYALDAATGKLKWQTKPKKKGIIEIGHEYPPFHAPDVMCSPAVSYGLVFVSIDNHMRGFDCQTGQDKWCALEGGTSQQLGAAAIGSGLLAYGQGFTKMSVFKAKTSRFLFGGGGVGNDGQGLTPVLYDKRLFHQGTRGVLYSQDLNNPNDLWRTLIGESKGRTNTGSKKDMAETSKYFGTLCCPAIASDTAVCGTADGYLSAIDISGKTGKEKWIIRLSSQINSSPSIARDIIYVGCDDGAIYAIELGTGKHLWKFKAEGKIWSPPCIGNGVVYFGCNDNYLYALH